MLSSIPCRTCSVPCLSWIIPCRSICVSCELALSVPMSLFRIFHTVIYLFGKNDAFLAMNSAFSTAVFICPIPEYLQVDIVPTIIAGFSSQKYSSAT